MKEKKIVTWTLNKTTNKGGSCLVGTSTISSSIRSMRTLSDGISYGISGKI
jgi:hypothetical protein